MNRFSRGAAAFAIALLSASAANADTLLGSYQARISEDDKHASDGYRLDTVPQMIRQDRANVHKFGVVDAEDQDDPWFGSTDSRARLERMLGKSGVMTGETRKAIADGEPVIQVDVYKNSVRVDIVGY
ncbi:MAG TPA: hypothetical protein VMF90_11145 [Rhizobiaceae bacterium]|jgi:hypothetical protein|nr:hypothetical protein [Rhizobiaceae bacterium]